MSGHGDHHAHGQHAHTHHAHGADFDWDAMADRLELDAAIVMPIVTAVAAEVGNASAVNRVLDVGCGPGVVACALARSLPDATVTAIDSSEPLVARTARAAHAAGLGDRVHAVVGDLEGELPAVAPADLVWAGMVLHHVADPVATLRRLHAMLRPGGRLVMIEFGPPPTLLPDAHPLQVDGTWDRFQHATSSVLNERLGLDPVTVDWPRHLAAAGFADVRDDTRSATHAPPLDGTALAWFDAHVRRGVEMATGRLDDRDAAALVHLANDPGHLAVTAHRRVLVAQRG